MWTLLTLTLLTAAPLEVKPPPPSLHLSAFYEKSTSALGLPIVSSKKVSDAALREAAFIVSKMLGSRPELGARIAKAGIRLVVMAPTEMTTDIPEHADLTPKAYWDRRARGLGATVERPAISCAEENLLSFPGDPYDTESICVHEFAHVIAQFGLAGDAGFTTKLQRTYEQALRDGLWKGTYASSNVDEYWAEAVQSYFDTNRVDDGEHGKIGTREQLIAADPRMAKLIRDSLGEVSWRYTRVANRTVRERELLGVLPKPPPTFAWPQGEEKAPQAGVEILLEHVRGELRASPASAESTNFSVINHSQLAIETLWVDFDGRLKLYTTLEPGRTTRQQTYVGHRWVIRNQRGVLGQFVAAPGEHELSISAD